LLAFFFVTLFRNEDDKSEMDDDGDDNKQLHEWKGSTGVNLLLILNQL
jgi:hypothetical protein